jgi:hypothetical protein
MDHVSPDEIRSAYDEYNGLLMLFNDLEIGMIELSLEEYKNMPAKTLELYRMYKNMVREKCRTQSK